MRTAPVKYHMRFGCRWGQPHDFRQVVDTKAYKIERCHICGARKKWNKGYHLRIDNNAYVKAHVRNYAQPGGTTKRVYAKMYTPEKLVIHI